MNSRKGASASKSPVYSRGVWAPLRVGGFWGVPPRVPIQTPSFKSCRMRCSDFQPASGLILQFKFSKVRSRPRLTSRCGPEPRPRPTPRTASPHSAHSVFHSNRCGAFRERSSEKMFPPPETYITYFYRQEKKENPFQKIR